jgi:hypothetical protein
VRPAGVRAEVNATSPSVQNHLATARNVPDERQPNCAFTIVILQIAPTARNVLAWGDSPRKRDARNNHALKGRDEGRYFTVNSIHGVASTFVVGAAVQLTIFEFPGAPLAGA